MALQEFGLARNNRLRELTPHGTLDFPCAGYELVYAKGTDEEIPWHRHEEIEIIYVKSGCLCLQVPGQRFRLEAGECGFINSNILHYGELEEGGILHSLVFHPTLITGTEDSVYARKYLGPLIRSQTLPFCPFLLGDPLTVHNTRRVRAAFEAIAREYAGFEFAAREQLSGFCLSIFSRYEKELSEKNGESRSDAIRIRKMIDFIQKHYQEDLSLSQIAGAAAIGERECLRCFKRTIQSSPLQYLIKYRVTKAAALILDDRESRIADIAGVCGFDSASSFGQMFKRYFSCTPRKYRERGGPVQEP